MIPFPRRLFPLCTVFEKRYIFVSIYKPDLAQSNPWVLVFPFYHGANLHTHTHTHSNLLNLVRISIRSFIMALGKKCRTSSLKRSVSFGGEARALGRKRIGISDFDDSDWSPKTPLKKQRSGRFDFDTETSQLEALPQEILVSPKP